MNTKILKRVCLTAICITIFAAMFAAQPAASYPTDQRGPWLDLFRRKVTRSPAAQLIEMTTGSPTGSDAWLGLIRPSDIEEMSRQGKTVSSRGGYHFCNVILNYRKPPLDDVNYRHALFHLIPKDRIIGNLFKYVVVKVDTFVPPAQNLWYNDKVDPHPYSPLEADSILADAGYQKVAGVWKGKDGSTLPNLRFFTPLEVVAPTSFTIGRMMVEEAQAIGLMNIVAEPMDFATYLDLMFNQWNFEMAWCCHSGLNPRGSTHLWSFFSSEENYKGSNNPTGIVYPELDAELSTLWRGLDHSAKVAAARKAQELLMGGNTTNQLPHNVLPSDPRHEALPRIPVYSRNLYDMQDARVRGGVNMFGAGLDNGWTYLTMHWADGVRPGTTANEMVWVEDEFPEKLNPLWATTAYAWDYLGPVGDGLLATNPYTSRDENWMANDWSYESNGKGGTFVNFDIKLKDSQGVDIKWQDGKAISANDIKFNWEFFKKWAIPNYWNVFKFYDNRTDPIVDADTLRANLTTTSQWLIYDLAGTAFTLAPQVWTKHPTLNRAWASTTEVIGFDPSMVPYTAAAAPGRVNPGPIDLPTCYFSVGPYILAHSTQYIGQNAYGDLLANRNYFMTTDEINEFVADMFHGAGDVDHNKKIEVNDLQVIGDNYGYTVPPGVPDADITGPAGTPPDGKINIDDLATAGKYFLETEAVP